MNNILENYTINANFWESNPEFTLIQPFKQLWKSDKSRGKGTSSNLMWGIAQVFHPKSEMYYLSDAKERVGIDLLGVKEKDVDKFWEDHKYLTDAFVDAALSQAEKSLIAWENRMKERDQFLAEQKYTFGFTDENGVDHKDNTKQLDDMLAKTAKIYDEYFKVKKELEEEEFINKKDKPKSSTATGEI